MNILWNKEKCESKNAFKILLKWSDTYFLKKTSSQEPGGLSGLCYDLRN